MQAPDILSGIILDSSASTRHRIDASKALDTLAANGPEATPASDRFQIIINLGGEVTRFNKSFTVDPNDLDPNDIAQGPLAVIAANKRRGENGSEPI